MIITLIFTVWSCLMLMLVCILWLDAMVYKPEPNPDIVVGLRTVILSAHIDWIVKVCPWAVYDFCCFTHICSEESLWNSARCFEIIAVLSPCQELLVNVRMTLWSPWAQKVIESRCSLNKCYEVFLASCWSVAGEPAQQHLLFPVSSCLSQSTL